MTLQPHVHFSAQTYHGSDGGSDVSDPMDLSPLEHAAHNPDSGSIYSPAVSHTAYLPSPSNLHPGTFASSAEAYSFRSFSDFLMIVPDSDEDHKYEISEDKQDLPLVSHAAFEHPDPSQFHTMGMAHRRLGRKPTVAYTHFQNMLMLPIQIAMLLIRRRLRRGGRRLRTLCAIQSSSG